MVIKPFLNCFILHPTPAPLDIYRASVCWTATKGVLEIIRTRLGPSFMDSSLQIYQRRGQPGYKSGSWMIQCDYSKKNQFPAGMLMYQLLTGSFPFWDSVQNISLQQVWQAILVKKVDLDSSSIVLSGGARDLLKRLLRRDPAKRMTALQALDHPWVKEGGSASENSLAGSVVLTLLSALKAKIVTGGNFCCISGGRAAWTGEVCWRDRSHAIQGCHKNIYSNAYLNQMANFAPENRLWQVKLTRLPLTLVPGIWQVMAFSISITERHNGHLSVFASSAGATIAEICHLWPSEAACAATDRRWHCSCQCRDVWKSGCPQVSNSREKISRHLVLIRTHPTISNLLCIPFETTDESLACWASVDQHNACAAPTEFNGETNEGKPILYMPVGLTARSKSGSQTYVYSPYQE